MKTSVSSAVLALSIFGSSVQAAAPSDGVSLLNRLPLSFEENRGQTWDEVRFLARGPGYTAWVLPDRVVVRRVEQCAQLDRDPRGPRAVTGSSIVTLRFLGADPNAETSGSSVQPGTLRFYEGRRAITTRGYARVAVEEPWPGIDLLHYGTGGALEHDFLVAPGADPSQIRLRLESGEGEQPQLQADGSLGLRAGNGLFRLERPVAYQDLASGRTPVAASYRLSPSGIVTIATAGHDPAYPLVIDPILRFSGFVGGNDRDTVNAVAVDRDGAIVLTGYTASGDFPAGPSGGPPSDAFVTKLTGDGTALVYTTILGSTLNDEVNAVAVDPWGNAVVVGRSGSNGFPITGGPLNGGTYGGGGDGFIARIAPDGTLLYSAYIGGTGYDEALGVAVDSVGDAYVVGSTSSADFVTVAGSHDLTLGGSEDAFLTKVRMLPGQNYVYSTYLGGAGTDQAYGVALAPGGRAPFVTGGTDGSFPVTTGQTVYGGGFSDAFVASFGSGGALLAATYYGGSDSDLALAVTLGRQGDPRIVGYTSSADLPLASAVQSTLGGSQDAFVLSLPPSLAGRFIATYFGGAGFDEASAVATDPSNAIVFVGSTEGLTPTPDALQTTFAGGQTDAFLARIGYTFLGGGDERPAGILPTVLYATYFGGAGDDSGLALAVDPQRHMILAGETHSSDFPNTPGVFDATCGSDGLCNGIWDGFVAKIGASRPCPNTSFTGPDAVGITHPPLSAIAAGDLGTPDGFDDLVVTTQQSGSPGVIVLENSTVATFSGLFSSVPGGASSVALGDLNGDGRLDIVVGRDGSGQYRSYSYANGGPFIQLSEGPLRAGVSSLALGEVNGDGILDLVYGHSAGYTVALGDGAGGFAGAPFDRTTSAPPGKVGFLDANQDGRLDIVAVLPGLDLIEVALGLGSGLFSAPTGIATAAGDQPRTFATGDLDRDGWTDLLVGNLGAATQVTVYLSDQTGGFVAGTHVTGLPAGVTDLVITDFHRDDFLDFNAVSSSTDRVWGCRGDGAGGFPGCGFKVQSYGVPIGIASGDFNGDGKLEFAIASADGDVRTEKNACASIVFTPSAFNLGLGMASGTATLAMDPAPLSPVTFDLHYPPAAMGQSQFSGPAQVTIAKDQTSVTFSLNGDVAGAASLLIAEAPASPFLSIVAGANVTVGTPASANLGITLTDSPDPVLIGGNITYTATVTNAGPDTSTSVVVTNAYPAGLVLLSAIPSQGTCTPGGMHVSCALGSIANAGTATVTLVYTVGGSPRVVSSTATVTSAVADPVSGNDSATTTTNASAPPSANLGVTLTDSPDPVLVGGSITYTATITNAGPDTATGVTLTQLKPAGATLVSAVSSQGACTPVPASVTCALGPIANAGSATVTMVYTADGPPGSVVATSTVASGVADPVSGNDSATATTTVSAPAASGAFRVIAGNPLTINVGADAAFQVFNVTVPGQGQIYPSGTSTLADMGVFVRRSGTLFAPDFSIHSDGTATSSIGAYTAWVPVSISNVTGAGTAVSPYQVVVVCDAGTTGLRLTMTVNYVNGDSFFTKTMSFASASQTAFDAFLGSDFYLANDDSGVPFLEPTSTSPGGQDCGTTPTYTILHIPLTPAQKYSARGYSTVWSEIGAGTLSNVVDAGCRDNGAALQWQSLTAGPSGPAIVDAATSFGAIPSIARFRVDAVTPAQGAPGQSLTVSVTGIGFQAGTQFAFGADITAQAPTILSPTSANVAISIAPGAALGFRDVLGTQSPGGLTSTLTNGFEVSGGGAVAPDLALSKSHGGNFSPGSTGTFTLTATNLGNGPTTGPVTIVDTLPAGLTFVSAAGPGWSCSAAGQTVTCVNSAPIPAGGASGFSLRTLVSQSAPSSLVNTATVSTAGDTNASNNSATDRANVSRQDFRIVVTPTSLTLAPGATGSVVVSATRQDNFSLPIAVTFAQTPGLTFSPQTFSLTTGATQTVSVTVAPDAVAGTPDVTISGTSNVSGSVVTRTAQLRVNIQIQADFDLVLSPTSLRLVTGGAAVPVQVSVQGRNGFTGTVNVTAPSLSGVTFTPSTFAIAAGASQTVDVAALANTGTGMTNAVFSGTATGITGPRTASLALTIVSAGDFSIDLSPSGISAGQGASVNVNVAITPQNGFNGSVALVVSPSDGVTVTPSSFALTAGTSRSVSLSISPTAEPGQRTLTFTGTASGVEGPRQAELRLTINPPPPQIVFFRANPASITAGQDTELSWDTANATSVALSPGGSVALTGSTRVSPTQTTVYTLTARGSGGSATSQLTVEVCNVPAAPTNLRILPFGRQDAPVSATDYLILSWDLPVEGSLPTRYEYRINGDAWVSTTERLVVVPPRGNTQNIQLFVRAYACTPELGFGPEGESAVVSLGAPIADFTMPPTAVVGAPVTITDLSLPPATSWLWLYDDGSPASTTQSQVHTFPRAGTFSVTLVAINGSGASTRTRTIVISAAAPAPVSLRAASSTPLVEGEPGRLRSASAVSAASSGAAGVRGELVVTSRSSREEIAYLRFLDANGTLLYERRLVLAPASGPARYDLSAFGVEGASSIELVSGARLSGSVEEPR